MIMAQIESIISTAHSFSQKLPLADKVLICARCNLEKKIGQLETKRCNKHFEMITSGFKPE